MRIAQRWLAGSLALLPSSALAGFPSRPEGVQTIQVPQYPGVSIDYKSTCICETSAKAWSGYVHMPISYLQDIEGSSPYNVSMFFWYFEAREDPQNAPTGVYFAGGPGESSMMGAVSDGGPCYINDDGNSTRLNPFSMNNKVNMLYVDQPVGSGFSYDKIVKSTVDLLWYGNGPEGYIGITPFHAYPDGVPPVENSTFKHAILPSLNLNHTANTTGTAAITYWHFSQAWFGSFPEYRTSDSRVSLWGNSYAGYWIPASAAYTQKQNAKIQSGEVSGIVIDVDAIGILNGCIDMLYEVEYYPEMATNNTYGVELIDKKTYNKVIAAYEQPKKGCRDLMLKCRAAQAKYDPDELGNNAEVNALCLAATSQCALVIYGSQGNKRSPFDMAHLLPDALPPSYPVGFFNREWVQEELGAHVNFTWASNVVGGSTVSTGDIFRREGMKDVEYLLDSGVKVSLVYGDRDMRCPWNGVENLSLKANWTGAEEFRGAGYEYIRTNKKYEGGVVRQYGNLSFARIFEAGHDSKYSPRAKAPRWRH